MTRPPIVRADTLDLQDHAAPSAKDHAHQPSHAAPLGIGPAAPHQAAAIKNVENERKSEEVALAEAWVAAGNYAEEPESIDDDHLRNSVNGTNGHKDDHDSTEPRNGEEKGGTEPQPESAASDDMLDRISSSPSIDDGGYILHSSPLAQPNRLTFLTPASSPAPQHNRFNESPNSTLDSSPFVSTPAHLPIQQKTIMRAMSPSLQQQQQSPPYIQAPPYFPILSNVTETVNNSPPSVSEHHHLGGEYIPDDNGLDDHEGTDPADAETSEAPINFAPAHPFASSMERLTAMPHEQDWPVEVDIDIRELLLPEHDPLCEGTRSREQPSPTGSSESWATETESVPPSFDETAPTNDDDVDGLFLHNNPRLVDSGWGGECLRDVEDIDFEFVYALHTFVATVEGQANATKGDTMVLLDDSNSYWWLVRVVKDSSIGYLPAEHIETPTERLARLNKHRNIDLSATMLGDNPEKSKNPLKKAIRRRKPKTVQFAAPTYVEASDYDYSTEDEEHVGNELQKNGVAHAEHDPNGQAAARAEMTEPMVNGDIADAPKDGLEEPGSGRTTPVGAAAKPVVTPDGVLDRSEAAPLKSRKGTVRNTDSFFKDDNVETRKITITPQMLRDDSNGSIKSSTASARSSSMESLEKHVSPPDKAKDDKKKKDKKPEKKPGMLSGLFKSKKKDKKGKAGEDDASDVERVSGELSRTSPMPSGSSSPVERTAPAGFPDSKQGPQRQGSKGKLQKAAPTSAPSATASAITVKMGPPTGFVELEGSQVAHEAPTERDTPSALRLRIDPEVVQGRPPSQSSQDVRVRSPAFQNVVSPTDARKDDNGPLSPIANMLRGSGGEEKPKKVKKAKTRVQLDDFDSPVDGEKAVNPFADGEMEPSGRLSESPVEIPRTFMHGTEAIHIPSMTGDGNLLEEAEDNDDDEPESLTSSPSIIEIPPEPAEGEGDDDDDDGTPT
ncbi:protein phosphatase regulator, partial [Elasticomyces elasticus]